MVSAAFEEAVRLGSGHAGPEHFLLALLRPDQHTLAAAVLRGCGADYDRLSSVLARAAAERPVEGDAGVTLNPVAHELIGRAEGLAAGLGAEEVEPEHLLLALVWAAQRDWPLAAAGTTREAVYEQLRAHGVGLAVPLPPSRPRPEGAEQCVYFPQVQLRDVLAGLPALLPPDADWGWNVDGAYRAWVRATGDFDLRERVRRALEAAPA